MLLVLLLGGERLETSGIAGPRGCDYWGARDSGWVSVWQEGRSSPFSRRCVTHIRVAFRIFVGISTIFRISGVASNPAPAGRA